MRRLVLGPLLVALQFLTILPVDHRHPLDTADTARSLYYYPLVGLLIGAVLVLLGYLLSDAPPQIAAALILAAWALCTGALHLDGLADSADAWLGGLNSREKSLAIMKDIHCGVAAVVTLMVVLLIKFTALSELIVTQQSASIVLAPVLARTSTVVLFATTPYIRPSGLGRVFGETVSRRASLLVVLGTFVMLAAVGGGSAWWALVASAGVFLLLRRLMLRRLGGTTGDTAGALIELTEAMVLTAVTLSH